MLRRKMTRILEDWKRSSRKALMLTGARQVGKSYAVRDFGRSNYLVYVEINLAIDREARTLLADASSPIDFINRIALLHPEPLIEHETLVFVDEVQEYPEIVTLMKGLVEDGRLSYILSGSMLGTEFKGVTSFPVGFVEQHVMRPLDFEEFSWAVGVDPRFLDQIRSCLRDRRSVEDYLHDTMMRNFRAYMVCGGMPEVVQRYIDSGFSLMETRALQSELVVQYGQDIAQYAGARALEVRRIFDQIPVQLEEDPHRFVLSSLEKGARFSTFDHDFLWLVHAGVGLMVQQVTEAKAPLKRTESASRFKLYQSDTGMLVSRYPQSTSRAIYLDRAQPNLGGIYENVVAQELTALGVGAWYYQSSEVGEVDFVIEGCAGRIVPIEVKSGRKMRSHAALDRLLGIDEYKIREAVVLSRLNVSVEDRVLYAPWYMAFCLDELTEREDTDFTFGPVVPQ